MNINYIEASTLVDIDRNILDNSHLTPAQYEIIRQVIYHTGDFEYSSLIKFANEPLLKGYKALISGIPIIVDVPEIQVSIVPRLQQTFSNPVYCCATTVNKPEKTKTKAALGLETIAKQHERAIVIIGQDRIALKVLSHLAKSQKVNPSLAIVTTPIFIEQDSHEYFKTAAFPIIYVDSSKGSPTVASAIFNALVNLSSRVSN